MNETTEPMNENKCLYCGKPFFDDESTSGPDLCKCLSLDVLERQ